ncbi:MAG: hypothetical protein AB1568_04565 [Thermodesulfobacteriota bacterium]
MTNSKRNSDEINKWIRMNLLSVTGIAEDLRVHHSLVSNTIAGRKNNRRVLQYLLDRNCPAKHLDIPEDMRRAA